MTRDKGLEPPRGLIEIEGLAMNGLLKSFNMVNCDEKGKFVKIVAEDIEGRRLETGCMEPDAARRQLLVLNMYLRQWSGLINRGAARADDDRYYR